MVYKRAALSAGSQLSGLASVDLEGSAQALSACHSGSPGCWPAGSEEAKNNSPLQSLPSLWVINLRPPVAAGLARQSLARRVRPTLHSAGGSSSSGNNNNNVPPPGFRARLAQESARPADNGAISALPAPHSAGTTEAAAAATSAASPSEAGRPCSPLGA